MAILNNNPLVGASGNQGGYNINNSLRFRSSASAYLNRTFSTNGTSQTKNSFSFWVKRGFLGVTSLLFEGYDGSSSNGGYIRFDSSDVLSYGFGGASVNLVSTTQVFRDPSAWYHIVIAVDTTQATASNRIKFYVNGSQVTTFGTANYPSQNATVQIFNSGYQSRIGRSNFGGGDNFDGYMAEVNFIDGQALTPSSFGETDTTTGVWKPKAYSGTYGTNGFYLKFSDIATTSGSNAGLGKDFSGNSNYWTTNNISVTSGTTYDAMTDVPTNTSATAANYCNFNSLIYRYNTGATTITNGGLTLSTTNSASSRFTFGSFAVSSGKWYWEVTITTMPTSIPAAMTIGIDNGVLAYDIFTGGYAINGDNFTTNDVIGIALNSDTSTLYIYKNNTLFSTTSITAQAYFPQVSVYYNSVANANFGQRPFTYTPPTGYVALNTFNLPDSTIKKGNSYFDAVTYNGSNSNLTVTNAGSFQPDLVWAKSRSGAYNNILVDAIRGGNLYLSSNTTAADTTSTGLATFTSSGITWIGGASGVNASGDTYVDWMWKAGNGTSSNTAGSITSTVSVNTTAGFSIVTYTGTGANATVGHGLGVAPKMVIVKQRNTTRSWYVYHGSLTSAANYLVLDSTAAAGSDTTLWNNTAPTSSVFSLGANIGGNQSTGTYVAYCFAEIAGFSKFGSYTGNGSADGTFVYFGFRPRFVMIKSATSVTEWHIIDTSRDTYNVANHRLQANSSAAEDVGGFTSYYDILSNGIKFRYSYMNDSGQTFIYAAFAESPFKNSLAR